LFSLEEIGHCRMTLPELHPELWIHIFEFVKRDVPPPWKYANWSDLHQEDLATVCRVSLVSIVAFTPSTIASCARSSQYGRQLTALQRFHSLAAPILYRTVVLPNLPILLGELHAFGNLPERPSSLKTAPLEVLLAQTQTLRIAGLPPPRRPKLRLEHLLQHGSEWWRQIGAKPKEDLEEARWVTLVELEALKTIFDNNPKQQDLTVFPNVQHIILGQRSFWHWSSFGITLATERKLLIACSSAFDRFISAHTPKSICTHSDQGPYSLFDASLVGPQFAKLQPTVTRHVYGQYKESAIIPGAKNRWHVYPGSLGRGVDNTIYGQPAPSGYAPAQDLCKSIGQAVFELRVKARDIPALVGRTSLETYGLAIIGPNIQERLHQAACGSDKASFFHQAAISTDPGFYAQDLATVRQQGKEILAGEVRSNDLLRSVLHGDGHLPHGEDWTQLVRLLLWRDVPPCKFCGWEMEDFVEELAAGLHPREAALARAMMGLGTERGQRLGVE
jgi:hypothetical protein